jgi:hypothetical protein
MTNAMTGQGRAHCGTKRSELIRATRSNTKEQCNEVSHGYYQAIQTG